MKNIKVKKMLFAAILFSSVMPVWGQQRMRGIRQFSVGVTIANAPGMGINGVVDFGFHPNITLGAEANTRFGLKSTSMHGISANVNYYFDKILNVPDEFDVYGGMSFGMYIVTKEKSIINEISSTNTLPGWGFQFGGRYFFAKNLGLTLQLAAGPYADGRLGLTARF